MTAGRKPELAVFLAAAMGAATNLRTEVETATAVAVSEMLAYRGRAEKAIKLLARASVLMEAGADETNVTRALANIIGKNVAAYNAIIKTNFGAAIPPIYAADSRSWAYFEEILGKIDPSQGFENARAALEDDWQRKVALFRVPFKYAIFFSCFFEAAYFVYLKHSDQLRGEGATGQKIVRAIEFKPEHKRAGMSILSYFAEIVQDKYPDEGIIVSIEQKGDVVSLVVDPGNGEKEKIEQSLSEYMLVVRGDTGAETVATGIEKVVALQNMLEMAQLEIRNQQRIMALQDKAYDNIKGRLEVLERSSSEQFSALTGLMSKSLDAQISSQANIQELIRALFDAGFQELPLALKGDVGKFDENGLRHELETLRDERPGLFDKLRDSLIYGPVQSASWMFIQGTIGMLIK